MELNASDFQIKCFNWCTLWEMRISEYVYDVHNNTQSIINPCQLSIVTLVPYQLRNSSISKSQHGDHRVGASAFP